ncbi:hypothetical protein HQQ82_09260 [Rathayibacter sp. VKM Ac-2856]|uniref:hypothetical protein n=1 Tax=unclassified Rathayibacter TaxID=2609250 RepID=UPI001567830C|nr:MULTISPECIES: hypothetical protein [unclassified Rathayibacter]NQX04986.1 hypothetical protein [Rathayibacter sp. VKM Ac-2858]NQX20154.1 hypothetical protein [Rathayibacter sp. VKM Ac-2856]
MIDSHKYNHSSLDQSRINQYAARVAKECKKETIAPILKREMRTEMVTAERRVGLFRRREMYQTTQNIPVDIEIIGEHWLLFQTNHHIEERETKSRYSEYHEMTTWVLDRRGRLLRVWKWEEYKKWGESLQDSRFSQDIEIRQMNDDDMLRLDYSSPQREVGGSNSKLHWWGTREAGKLIRHAKGVGISIALKQLLD